LACGKRVAKNGAQAKAHSFTLADLPYAGKEIILFKLADDFRHGLLELLAGLRDSGLLRRD